ncbi:flagellar hook-associated protein 3 FlgL [Luteibacter rhizovicinus]|uniref:Flagellar hook-associated protein 3 FlgL n=1 Tax=Luteibacter rhizovicinus TaxID=242606 RepID=A0A4R3YST4_9GAMM|nr:flagellar hook-associated protein FlgL [Luteibacter rhizovicinus]TCV94143.1 flagellar hook-associated protein 3 FlgL [Luteibacter rhizovicinus]
MRISTSWGQQQSVNSMLDHQYQLSQTQLSITTGKAILTPADNPAGAARVLDLSHASAQNDQYKVNMQSATSRLSVEESTLSSSADILDRIRTLALQANNGTQTDESRASIAKEMQQNLNQLVALANTKDGQGEYIFAGSKTLTQPFVTNAGKISYVGDQSQRMIAAAAGLQIATGDSGDDVFMAIRGGNGTFTTTAATTNTGTGVVGATSVTDMSQWDGGSYKINFTQANASGVGTDYEVRATDGTLVSSGTYTGDNGSIGFKGVQIPVTGTPAVGDSFAVAPSSSQDMFSTIGNMISAIEKPGGGAPMNNIVNAQLQNLDQAMGSVVNTRTKIGARMNTIDQQTSVGDDVALQYASSISDLQDVDMASAISKYSQQQTALNAAQQTFVKMQSLSLFNYLK